MTIRESEKFLSDKERYKLIARGRIFRIVWNVRS